MLQESIIWEKAKSLQINEKVKISFVLKFLQAKERVSTCAQDSVLGIWFWVVSEIQVELKFAQKSVQSSFPVILKIA